MGGMSCFIMVNDGSVGWLPIIICYLNLYLGSYGIIILTSGSHRWLTVTVGW